ncbi:MAG: CoA pyrophosphatase [Dehalococcoidia bacterium]
MRERLREALSRRQKGPCLVAGEEDQGPPMPAAVLLPIFRKGDGYHVLLTRRTQEVEHHKGQISFPGGARGPEDESLEATALRESWEEVGLEPGDVDVLGELDDMVTITNFEVRPFVGLIPHPYPFQLCAAEVESLIEVPLQFLLDPGNCREETHPGDSSHVHYSFEYDGNVIWGATARILNQFLFVLRVFVLR